MSFAVSLLNSPSELSESSELSELSELPESSELPELPESSESLESSESFNDSDSILLKECLTYISSNSLFSSIFSGRFSLNLSKYSSSLVHIDNNSLSFS